MEDYDWGDGDPRRCDRHPEQKTSSPDGMFDAPCPACEAEMDYYDEEDLIDGVGFADPGGRSALRAATRGNPRDQPCPNCDTPNVLTRIDVQCGYQCDRCADRAERGLDY
jgi:hypothetical protein